MFSRKRRSATSTSSSRGVRPGGSGAKVGASAAGTSSSNSASGLQPLRLRRRRQGRRVRVPHGVEHVGAPPHDLHSARNNAPAAKPRSAIAARSNVNVGAPSSVTAAATGGSVRATGCCIVRSLRGLGRRALHRRRRGGRWLRRWLGLSGCARIAHVARHQVADDAAPQRRPHLRQRHARGWSACRQTAAPQQCRQVRAAVRLARRRSGPAGLFAPCASTCAARAARSGSTSGCPAVPDCSAP